MKSFDEMTPLASFTVAVEAELDRRTMTVREIVELGEGSIIATNRSAGENIDIYVGGVLVGCGEIVVIENSMGVRLADLQDHE